MKDSTSTVDPRSWHCHAVRQTSDINVLDTRVLPRPMDLLAEIPPTGEQSDLISRARQEIHRIIFGNDRRLLIIVGPCSIHDVESGREYAQRLAGNRAPDPGNTSGHGTPVLLKTPRQDLRNNQPIFRELTLNR